MHIHFGFSWLGLLFLLLLFVPNILWSKQKPKDYDRYVKQENKVFVLLERIGEILVTCYVLFTDIRLKPIANDFILFILSCMLMLLYELYWIRYFKSNKTMQDMYSSILGIPVAGATLPVMSFVLLAIYEQNISLFIATLVLGVGHIGIHMNHKNKIRRKKK